MFKKTKDLNERAEACIKTLGWIKFNTANSEEHTFPYAVHHYIEEVIELIKEQNEILDILKKNLYLDKGTGRFKGIEVIECSLGSEHSGDKFERIKKWLGEKCEGDISKRFSK